MPVRKIARPLVPILIALFTACGGGGDDGGGGDVAAGPAAVIKVLSNRADLISGGDALVEVVPPTGVAATALGVELNGTNVTSAFAVRANGRYMGVVSGLILGDNVLRATAPGATTAQYTIRNHPHGGPVIAGPQLQPWGCQAGAVDAQCNQDPVYEYVYLSTDGGEFQPYDPANPPGDVAETTTDEGVTVPFIVRVETGYQDRDQYKIATLFQPDQGWTPYAPQEQSNRKLVITHGASCGVDYRVDDAPSVTNYDPVEAITGEPPATPVADAVEHALGAGFMVMSTALNNAGHNCNLALQAESLIMAKEYLVERYGELRYTIGVGCSGGSLTQQWVANAYPGIYQGILPTCSFPDAWSTATQFLDYHLLLAYFQDPSVWGDGVVWTPDQMAQVEGHVTVANANVSEQAQFHVVLPTDPCSGISDEQRYHPETNPDGVRCSIVDAAKNVFGPRPASDWSANEQLLGYGFTGVPMDNTGVQYGLAVLMSGQITPEQFLDVNEKAGGLDIDINPVPERLVATAPALVNAYRAGMINETNNLDRTPIIDCRGPDPGAFHDSYRAYAIRARLDREHGGHPNQLIWEGPALIIGDTQCLELSLIAMDEWLAAVEADDSTKPLAQKIVDDKPAELTDRCYDGNGTKVADAICGDPVVPVYGTPRTVAGDAISTDTNKCQLKPLNRDDYTIIPMVNLFTDAQWARMQALYPDGVCDFSKPGVSQQGTVEWLAYQDATGAVVYGGTPLPAPPANSGAGWADASFR